jgi:hypothetical protein
MAGLCVGIKFHQISSKQHAHPQSASTVHLPVSFVDENFMLFYFMNLIVSFDFICLDKITQAVLKSPRWGIRSLTLFQS